MNLLDMLFLYIMISSVVKKELDEVSVGTVTGVDTCTMVV